MNETEERVDNGGGGGVSITVGGVDYNVTGSIAADEGNSTGGYEGNSTEGYEGNSTEGYEGNVTEGYEWNVTEGNMTEGYEGNVTGGDEGNVTKDDEKKVTITIGGFDEATTGSIAADADEGSVLDQVKDQVKNVTDNVKDEVTFIMNNDPSQWTTEQTIAVAVGMAVTVLVVGYIAYRCYKRRQRWSPPYKLEMPRVTRTVANTTPDVYGNPPWGARLHGAPKLHKAGLTGKGVRVAVIDSGIDKDHPQFHGKVKKQLWYRSGTPLSEDDHGTHVAGTIHFMAPDAELYDYRVFGQNGDIDGDIAVAQAIEQACEDGCQIINMSLRVSYPIVPEVRAAVKLAYSKGVHIICAAGNDGDGDPLTNELNAYPARWKETISVAAVKKSGNLPVAEFSESNPQVDYAAIGVDVTSLKPGGGFQTMQGTSMAAPHVSGFVAALLTEKEGLTPSDTKMLNQELSEKYTIDIGAEGRDNATGVGFVTFLTKPELDDMWKGSEFQVSSLLPANIL